MTKPLISDHLRVVITPLLPHEPPKPKGGRLGISDRAALTDLLFVLKSSLPGQRRPPEPGCGLPGSTVAALLAVLL